MRFNMLEWRDKVISSKRRIAVPIMTHPGIVLRGHTVLETVTNPRLHVEAVQAVAATYPTGASTMIMDLSVEAEAFGASVRFADDEVPMVQSRLVSDMDSIRKLAVPDLSQARVGDWVQAAEAIAQSISDRPVFAECIGPFSLAARLYDVTEILTAILIEPESIHLLLEKCTDFLKSYVAAFKAAGANAVLMAEPVAGVLSSDLCTEFSSNYLKEIVKSVQDDQFFVILHNCGETNTLISSMHGTGARGLHFGNRCDIVKALAQLPFDTLVFGNIDPVGIFKSGTPESVKGETLRLLESAAAYHNFILSSGCDVPPNVPLENIDAFFQALTFFNLGRSD